MLVSLCVAPTEMLLLKNLFTVLEFNAFTKIHKTAVNSAALTALHGANNIVSGLERRINKKPHKWEGCLPAWTGGTCSDMSHWGKSQPDSGARHKFLSLWEPFRSQNH